MRLKQIEKQGMIRILKSKLEQKIKKVGKNLQKYSDISGKLKVSGKSLNQNESVTYLR
jgi:hypothetical protein